MCTYILKSDIDNVIDSCSHISVENCSLPFLSCLAGVHLADALMHMKFDQLEPRALKLSKTTEILYACIYFWLIEFHQMSKN